MKGFINVKGKLYKRISQKEIQERYEASNKAIEARQRDGSMAKEVARLGPSDSEIKQDEEKLAMYGIARQGVKKKISNPIQPLIVQLAKEHKKIRKQ